MTTNLKWKWYEYGINTKYDCWQVKNLATKKSILTSTEEACLKIIELAYTLKTGKRKPLNHRPLEQKAKHLEAIPLNAQRHWDWTGETLTYDTTGFK